MQIVTDGYDLSPQQEEGSPDSFAAAEAHLEQRILSQRIDIQPEEFYRCWKIPTICPQRQPHPRVNFLNSTKIAETDTDILSVHISSGLSGTLGVAQVAAEPATTPQYSTGRYPYAFW